MKMSVLNRLDDSDDFNALRRVRIYGSIASNGCLLRLADDI